MTEWYWVGYAVAVLLIAAWLGSHLQEVGAGVLFLAAFLALGWPVWLAIVIMIWLLRNGRSLVTQGAIDRASGIGSRIGRYFG